MKHFDTALKQYAKSGYRSSEEWASLGREVVAGARARIEATQRGSPVGLYTGDQTRVKSRSERAGPTNRAAGVPAPVR
jgi:hypothetical protein